MTFQKTFSAMIFAAMVCRNTPAYQGDFQADPTMTASAADHIELTDGALTYNVYDKYAVVTKCAASATSVKIPDTVEGKVVTIIGKSAFANCVELVSVTLPDTIEEIGNSAFEGCSSLVRITIPKTVIKIDNQAFTNCPAQYLCSGVC